MSKRKFELVSSADVDVLPEIDWNRCVICQTEKKRSSFAQITANNIININIIGNGNWHININSLAMVKHTMKVTKRAVDSLNKNQIPVIIADQPVYALGKQLQWLFPHHYGEDKFVIMMGGLHIEMATLSMIGDWLEGSGWSDLITTAQVFTSGTSDALLSAFHVKKIQVRPSSICCCFASVAENCLREKANSRKRRKL